MSPHRRPPLIGVTPGFAGPSDARDFCRAADILYCDVSYLRCVEAAGGVPVLLPHLNGESLGHVVEQIDGLLLTGGEDVHPGRYGQEIRFQNGAISQARDGFEIELLRAFLPSGKPVLAVCRGIQVLNVVTGGTLIQDLPAETRQLHHAQRAATTVPTHSVRLLERSRLARAVGATVLEVNSHHHQAVDRVAPELTAVGWSEEGIVEAVESRGEAYIVGVQWHPERLAATRGIQHRIFESLVQACRIRV
jgi:putative glutamine amidotransferase